MDKHKRWPKGRRRKPYSRERDENAPRRPLNGYVRFMTDKRDAVASQNPELSFAEVTKILGNQWTSLPQEEKQKYLDSAENEKAQYLQKLKSYNQSKQTRDNESPGPSKVSPISRKQSDSPISNPEDIPIFTEAFLDHNKAKDAELRQLKKSNAEYAEQSAMLQRHIDNLQSAITRLDSEAQTQIQANSKLNSKLQNMQETVVKMFKDLPIPGSSIVLMPSTAESYMNEVCHMMENPTNENKTFIGNVQEIMLKSKFTIASAMR